MMKAQKELCRHCLPSPVEPRTNKQKLWNDVIQFLSNKNCKWGSGEIASCGVSLVQALTNALWYVDGQHDVFGKQGYSIPSTFSSFMGYNCPELSKHRKRERGNMSAQILKSLSSHLFMCLQGAYWSRDYWSGIKVDIEQLTKSIDDYSSYLQRSCKKVIFNQSLSFPVREISEHLLFQFLPVIHCELVSETLKKLHNHLKSQPELVPVSVEEYSPSDPKEKYTYFKTLKSSGLQFPTALLTYTHGNNVGNLNFVWKVQSISDLSFSQCQPVIENIKKDIPKFHTRAMRREVFSLFGRLTSSVKPAIMRHIYRTLTGEYTYM